MAAKKPIENSYALFGVFGHPLINTPSPAMMAAGFDALKLEYVYLPFRVEQKFSKNIAVTMRLMDMVGANITAPYKEIIMGQLDSVDREAKKIGSVNTIVSKNGKLTGYNTDGVGFLKALEVDNKVRPKHKVITIIGSGGTARAIAHTLATAGASTIHILNRTKKRADQLAQILPEKITGHVAKLSKSSLEKTLPETDILIQTTSHFFDDLPLTPLKRGGVIADVHYHTSPLANLAKHHKIRYINGIDMLVRQGEAAFHLFTGKKVDPKILKQTTLRFLRTLK